MNYPVSIRVTRQSKSREGFYALINGKRIWFKRRAHAVGAIVSVLELQRFQVLTVRQYAARRQR